MPYPLSALLIFFFKPQYIVLFYSQEKSYLANRILKDKFQHLKLVTDKQKQENFQHVKLVTDKQKHE
jgi:hypothetical protein